MPAIRKIKRKETNYLRWLFRYDPESGHVIRQNKMKKDPYSSIGDIVGSITSKGYLRVTYRWKGKLREVLAHRFAWLLHHGEWPDKEIDHINRNKTDNRIANLRLATCSQNHMNILGRRDNTSGHRGITWHKRDNRWQVSIGFEGKPLYLGQFKSFKKAVRVRKKAEKRIFREYRPVG